MKNFIFKIKKKYHINQRLIYRPGFTLIELLVVIIIIILLVALYIPQYRRFSRRNELTLSVQQLREVVLRAQSLALAPQDSSPDSSKNLSYYRFVFYPDPQRIKYKIRIGAVDYDPTDPIPSLSDLNNEREVIGESGSISSNIEYYSGALINNTEGTIIFKMITGECYYAWQKTGTDQKYTFKNKVNDKAWVNLNMASCRADIGKQY